MNLVICGLTYKALFVYTNTASNIPALTWFLPAFFKSLSIIQEWISLKKVVLNVGTKIILDFRLDMQGILLCFFSFNNYDVPINDVFNYIYIIINCLGVKLQCSYL